MGTPNWANLTPDLLRCVFERLSFTTLNRAKLVCRMWYSASKGCVPQNQIPWLIFFLPKGNRCVIFVPEENKLYTIRYLGREFAESLFLRSCGSWFLMLNALRNFYIVNPFTGERIDLPVGPEITDHPRGLLARGQIAFWIDNKTKDYLVVVMTGFKRFTKSGFNSWENLDCKSLCQDVFYNDKTKKLYIYFFDVDHNGLFDIWDFSSGDMPHLDKSVSLPWFRFHSPDPLIDLPFHERNIKSNMAVTVSGDILIVQCIPKDLHPWYFCIYKRNEVENKWEKTNFLGDEALIYDLGITVTANDSILGIKRNSIYFSHSQDIFVYDLTTQHKEPLPPCIRSSMPPFIWTHWFFPS